MKKELLIEAKVDNLERVLEFMHRELDKSGCSAKTKMELDLAIEEIFVNIASYAYAPQVGLANLSIETAGDPLCVTLTFADGGTPFDPLAKKDPDITLSAEDRAIGGLGIFMVKKGMDNVNYEYRDGRNILTIRKNL